MYYKCTYFKIHELVDPEIYHSRGEKAWQLFDYRLLELIDNLREHYREEYNASMTINDWKWGGNRQWSGLRTPSSKYYSSTSQHSYGRAVDFILKDVKTKKRIDMSIIRQEIIDNPDEFLFDPITCIENFDGMTWAHIDIRNWDKDQNGLLVVDS